MSAALLSASLRLQDSLWPFIPPAADVPFWERPVCPAELLPVLFPAQPDGMRLYFLVDATLRKAAKGAFDLDVVAADLPARSLFLPRDDEDRVAESAPWLLDLTAARTDRAAGRFLQDMFATQWARETGLFVVSRAGFDDLFGHLRRLTRLECDWQADRLFFRFWDPSVYVPYLRASSERPERLRQMLMLRDGTPLHLVAAAGPGRAVALVPASGGDPAGLPPPAPMTLDRDDLRAFSAGVMETLGRQLGRWLAASYPDRFGAMSEDRVARAGRHAVRVGQEFGFTEKADFAYLAHMMTVLGGYFHHSGVPEASLAILASAQARRHQRLSQMFMADYLTTPQGRVALDRPAVLADLVAIPGAPYISFEVLKGFLERRFSAQRATTGRFVQAVWRAHDADGVPDELRVPVSLLSVVHGLRFYDDPFRDLRDPSLSGPARIADAVSCGWAGLMAETSAVPA